MIAFWRRWSVMRRSFQNKGFSTKPAGKKAHARSFSIFSDKIKKNACVIRHDGCILIYSHAYAWLRANAQSVNPGRRFAHAHWPSTVFRGAVFGAAKNGRTAVIAEKQAF